MAAIKFIMKIILDTAGEMGERFEIDLFA